MYENISICSYEDSIRYDIDVTILFISTSFLFDSY